MPRGLTVTYLALAALVVAACSTVQPTWPDVTCEGVEFGLCGEAHAEARATGLSRDLTGMIESAVVRPTRFRAPEGYDCLPVVDVAFEFREARPVLVTVGQWDGKLLVCTY